MSNPWDFPYTTDLLLICLFSMLKCGVFPFTCNVKSSRGKKVTWNTKISLNNYTNCTMLVFSIHTKPMWLECTQYNKTAFIHHINVTALVYCKISTIIVLTHLQYYHPKSIFQIFTRCSTSFWVWTSICG